MQAEQFTSPEPEHRLQVHCPVLPHFGHGGSVLHVLPPLGHEAMRLPKQSSHFWRPLPWQMWQALITSEWGMDSSCSPSLKCSLNEREDGSAQRTKKRKEENKNRKRSKEKDNIKQRKQNKKSEWTKANKTNKLQSNKIKYTSNKQPTGQTKETNKQQTNKQNKIQLADLSVTVTCHGLGFLPLWSAPSDEAKPTWGFSTKVKMVTKTKLNQKK